MSMPAVTISDHPQRRPCFTLIELLTVMAVVAMLTALLLPALGSARGKARMTACLGQVRQIGVAVHLYAGSYRDYLPVSARLRPEPLLNLPALPTQLAPFIGDPAVFHCPADTGEDCLYDDCSTSYEWNTLVNGRRIDRPTMRVAGLDIVAPLLGDADPFHRGRGRNFLYSDGRVTSSLEVLIDAP